MLRDAELSDDGLYRYRLGRRWGNGGYLLFVMLNPSTADASIDDATIRRCIRIAKRLGYHAIQVVNLFAWRSTDKRMLGKARHPIGPRNDRVIISAARGARKIIVAWGGWLPKGHGMRASVVRSMLALEGKTVYALMAGKNGSPVHPLVRRKWNGCLVEWKP